MLAALVLLFLSLSLPAQAEPVSLGFAVATFFGTAVAVETAFLIGAVINVGLAVGLSYAASALAPKAGSVGSAKANDPGIRYSTRQSAPAKRKAYGECHVGGALFFEKVSPPFLVQGFLIHEGEIESVDGIFIGTNRLSFPSGITENTILTPSNVEGQPDYAGFVRCCVRYGSDDQTHDELLRDRFGVDIIPDSFRQRGIATVVIEYEHPGPNEFELFQELWGGGRHPQAFFLIKGKKRIYDPRVPSHILGDESTWSYSNNATLCQTDYMRAEYGGRITPNKIDWDKVKLAADYDDSGMRTIDDMFIKKHTVDGLFTLDQAPSDVMADLLSANRGSFTQEGGNAWPDSSRPKDVVLVINDRLLTGGLQYQPYKNRRELINIVEPRFVSKELNYEIIPGPDYRDEDLIIAHGEEHHFALSLPFTLDHRRAQRLSKLFHLNAQQERSIAIQVDLEALALATGSLTGGVITLESELFPQANGNYEVKKLSFVDGFGAIELACVEYDSSIEADWNPSADEQEFDPIPEAA